jgi:hypothetical protein
VWDGIEGRLDYMYCTVKNLKTGRSYPVEISAGQTMETVWKSQMCWFGIGAKVSITDENGNTEYFSK